MPKWESANSHLLSTVKMTVQYSRVQLEAAGRDRLVYIESISSHLPCGRDDSNETHPSPRSQVDTFKTSLGAFPISAHETPHWSNEI